MPGDIAVRTRVASISIRALRSAFSMTSRVTGSISTVLNGLSLAWMIRAGMGLLPSGQVDQDVADRVDSADAIAFDQGGRVHLGHDSGSGDHVTGFQLGPVIDRGGRHRAVEPQFVVADLGLDGIAVAFRQAQRFEFEQRPKRYGA